MEVNAYLWDGESRVNGVDKEIFIKSYPFARNSKAILINIDGRTIEVVNFSQLKDKNGWGNYSDEEVLLKVREEFIYFNLKNEIRDGIEKRDKQSDIFYIQLGEDGPKFGLWLPSQFRTQLLTSTIPAELEAGKSSMRLWDENSGLQLPVPTQWLADNLPIVEHYAITTLNVRKNIEALAKMATTIEALDAIDVEAAYVGIEPPILVIDPTDLAQDVQHYYEQLSKISETEQVTTISQLSTTSVAAVSFNMVYMSDELALRMKDNHPDWDNEEEIYAGMYMKAGFRFKSEGQCWKTKIEIASLDKTHRPGTATLSIFTPINEEHSGTKEDPIPYVIGMTMDLGKFYSELGVTYECIRNLTVSGGWTLAGLVGDYVRIAD